MTTTSTYRSYVWNMKGNREYTKMGYEAAVGKFDPNAMEVDCTGRHIMITGANKGLGLCTALQLARKGAVLHLVCRNMEDARSARAEIVTETGNDRVHLYHLDLSKPRDVMKFCDDFKTNHDQLHVLINNAGIMIHERKLDSDGIEFNFAVNTLAPHLLTVGLMPLIQKVEDGRVIMVSSAGMLCVRLDPVDLSFETMNPYNGRLAYSQNKRQQVVLALNYAQKFDKVHFSSMHPGWVDTLAVRTSIPQFYEMMKDKLRTVEQGADTIIWLAISQRARTYNSGLFFQDRESVATHLPLAWTRSTLAEESMFIDKLNLLVDMITSNSQNIQNVDEINANSPVFKKVPSDILEETVSSDDKEEPKNSLQTTTEAHNNNKIETPQMSGNSDRSFSEPSTNNTKEERGESSFVSESTTTEDSFVTKNIEPFASFPVSDAAEEDVAGNDESGSVETQNASTSHTGHVDEEKSNNIFNKITEDSTLTAMTENLESTKIEDSSKESTVS